jgi:hypothetical protein
MENLNKEALEQNPGLQELLIEELGMLTTKGIEYTRGSSDRLDNFKRLAKMLNTSKYQVLGVYMQKHLDAIFNFILTQQTFSNETIRGRIIDARNYLYLLALMVEEDAEKEN